MPRTSDRGPGSARRPIGRPRRLSLRQVIDAGVEMGLNDISISGLARRLGVSVGTIYGYVRNLDEIKRLVAAYLIERPVLEDKGQHWTEIVRLHAARQYATIAREPKLTAEIIEGAMDIEYAMVEVETFLALLAARGFTTKKAFEIHQAASQIAAGAAFSAVISQSRMRRGEPRQEQVQHALRRLPAEALPHLRSVADDFGDEDRFHDFGPALERVLRTFTKEERTIREPNSPERRRGRARKSSLAIIRKASGEPT